MSSQQGTLRHRACHVIAHADYFEAMNGVALLREALQNRSITRVFQLHEFGDPDYEIELGILEPGYSDGGERYSTSAQSDWVVYASHESLSNSSPTLGPE